MSPPLMGTKRVCTQFVIWKSIGNETRWFEKASWEEEYKTVLFTWEDGAAGGGQYEDDVWVPIRWIN